MPSDPPSFDLPRPPVLRRRSTRRGAPSLDRALGAPLPCPRAHLHALFASELGPFYRCSGCGHRWLDPL
jgi:hypothetical protein